LVSGCSDGDTNSGAEKDPVSSETTVVSPTTEAVEQATEGPAVGAASAVDQSPPKGINGFVLVGDRIYAAAGNDDQVLAIDPEDGTILARYEGLGWPDDVDVLPDGSLGVTGFQSGVLSRIDKDGKVSAIADMGVGINPILTVSDTELLVGKAISADGLWRVNPNDGTTEEIASALGGVNSFDLAPDGRLIGPRMGMGEGAPALVAVDLATGESTDIVGVTGMPVAVEVDGDTAYVLNAMPPTLYTVDLSTPGGKLETLTELNFAPDNLEIGADGTVWISSFSTPLMAHIVDGKVTDLPIGTP
jgi:hypothetical protein